MRTRIKQHENIVQFSNHLRSVRTKQGFSQGELANRAGITRQAVSSIESNRYLPTTAVALRLASTLTCRVEDLFSLAQAEEIIEGTLIGRLQAETQTQSIRVKVSTVGRRTIVRPVANLGEALLSADRPEVVGKLNSVFVLFDPCAHGGVV